MKLDDALGKDSEDFITSHIENIRNGIKKWIKAGHVLENDGDVYLWDDKEERGHKTSGLRMDYVYAELPSAVAKRTDIPALVNPKLEFDLTKRFEKLLPKLYKEIISAKE